jgi:RNA polymerase sigma factor (sigma-70 family)
VLRTLDDNALFEHVRRDNELAYNELYNRYWEKLYFVAYKHLGSDLDAREIVQEVFIAIWVRRKTLQITFFPAYVAAITRYAVYASIERKRKEAERVKFEPVASGLPEAISEFLENKWMLEKISRLSAELPEKCRLVFIKNKLLDQSLTQVAADLHISRKTAETHLAKALKIIRKQLEGIASSLFL